MAGLRFEGKAVLITGGNSGIGLATARAFAAEGADVAISGRNEKTIEAAVASLGGKAFGVPADLARFADIERLMAAVKQWLGRLDVLFANAGIARFGAIGAMTEADWDEIMGANLKGLYFTVQQALPLMGKGSAIVLNSSVAGSIGAPDSSIYAASKAAVQSLTRSLGAELVGAGVRVNAVSPGPIDTPLFNTLGMAEGAVSDLKKEWAAGDPMGRFGAADEVAQAVLFLASSQASYITGANLPVDGGLANF
jgi:NAD(P)-dependent dehydrogenase (short-subunit alcohol dehydrogenase family)